jgi:hypothetical protein
VGKEVIGATLVEAVELLVKAIEAEPAIEAAIAHVFLARKSGAPLTPALKHLEALADAKLLHLNPDKV